MERSATRGIGVVSPTQQMSMQQDFLHRALLVACPPFHTSLRLPDSLEATEAGVRRYAGACFVYGWGQINDMVGGWNLDDCIRCRVVHSSRACHHWPMGMYRTGRWYILEITDSFSNCDCDYSRAWNIGGHVGLRASLISPDQHRWRTVPVFDS
jgi:hypothetical protein